ncbi:hypothetical protein ACN92M_25925 (plasmid) [Paenibacillus polymyxa]|uniref:hypothetical protein n=1 Tax=Paenibacillus polymyxa TaxID=1406 RepID=UPI003B5C75A2
MCVPSIRMYCADFEIGFVLAYQFVWPKQRTAISFVLTPAGHVLGATDTHSAQIQAMVSTVQVMHNWVVPILCRTPKSW